MGKHQAAINAAKAAANQAAYMEKLAQQSASLPGTKLMTCPTCMRICVVPEAWTNIPHIAYGMGGNPVHPGIFNPSN